MGLDDEDIVALLDQWDNLDEAIKRVMVSQLMTMTEAADRLEKQRKLMGAMIRTISRPRVA